MGVKNITNALIKLVNEAADLRKLGGTQAERMARAAEQGYDTSRTLYHGGANDFDAFADSRRGVYLSDNPDIAGIYADNAQKRWPGQNNAEPNIIAGYVKGRPLVVSDQGPSGGGWLSDNMAAALNVSLDGVPTKNRAAFLNDEARRQGYGYVEIQDMDDLGGRQTQIRLLDNGNIRSIYADFNPANRDSPNLLAGIANLAAPLLKTAATGTALYTGAAALAPEQVNAGPLQSLGRAAPYLTSAALGGAAALQSGDAEAFSAQPYELPKPTPIDIFRAKRAGKRGAMDQMKLELQTLIKGVNEVANDVIFPALDKPLQGYLGLGAAFGALAGGGSFEQAIGAGAQVAQQPTGETTYNMGGTVTDALSPYVPAPVAAGAGALTNAGLLLGSPL